MRTLPILALLLAAVLTAGCDALGIESGTVVAARKEADGRAVGSACRHAMRAIEDCYTLNPKAAKAAVYAGWREMDEYMRDNKIDGVAPVVPRKSARQAPPAQTEGGESADPDSRNGHGAGTEDGPPGGGADSHADDERPSSRARSHDKVAARQATTH